MAEQRNRTFHAQAVVLRHVEYGEADRILTLFSLERGKFQAIAKGVRKIKSRKAGHLEPFTHVSLFLAEGRNLAIITQAETIRNFAGIKADLKLTGYAAYAIELLDRFTQEEGRNPELFQLLVETLQRLEDDPEPLTSLHYYEVQLLALLGFRPELNKCVACGKKIEPVDQYFSPKLGGVLCPNCNAKDPQAWRISMPVLKYFRFFQRSAYSQVRGRVIPPQVEPELKALLERYFTYLLEYGLRTPKFIQAVS